MQLADVNVLVNAFRTDTAHHEQCRGWLTEVLMSNQRYATSDLILSSAVRILTNRRIYANPENLETALEFVELVRSQPHCVNITPGARHWDIFTNLCRTLAVMGGRTSDAYFAALALEHGCEWVSFDQHFARIPGLRWRLPSL